MIIEGDCIDVMAGMDPESVDAIVTDPPYGLEFMGKEWDKVGRRIGHHLDPSKDIVKDSGAEPRAKDNPWQKEATGYGAPQKNWRCRRCGRLKFGQDKYRCVCERPDWDARTREYGLVMQAWHQRWAEAAYRVAKPSAYLLAFGGTRTVHRMTVALEDAGWIIRDMLVWGYASGFPKSKASLKPAWEPIVMARKPGPLRDLAIDACRIGYEPDDMAARTARTGTHAGQAYGHRGVVPMSDGEVAPVNPAGRWPANIVLTDAIFDGGIEGVVGGGATLPGSGVASANSRGWAGWQGDGSEYIGTPALEQWREYVEAHDDAPPSGWGGGVGDSGTYSRFFLIPKADRADREPVLGGQLPRVDVFRNHQPDNPKCLTCGRQRVGPLGAPACECEEPNWAVVGDKQRENSHPTVKPTDLMRHLVRLVTPTGGTVLDPFLGSGTTGLAAEMEGFPWIGIERELEYVKIAEARLNGTQRGLGLEAI